MMNCTETAAKENIPAKYVRLDGLMAYLQMGRNRADELGVKAGAVRRYGRVKLYNLEKIDAFIEAQEA